MTLGWHIRVVGTEIWRVSTRTVHLRSMDLREKLLASQRQNNLLYETLRADLKYRRYKEKTKLATPTFGQKK